MTREEYSLLKIGDTVYYGKVNPNNLSVKVTPYKVKYKMSYNRTIVLSNGYFSYSLISLTKEKARDLAKYLFVNNLKKDIVSLKKEIDFSNKEISYFKEKIENNKIRIIDIKKNINIISNMRKYK